jgi:hypothetical protein
MITVSQCVICEGRIERLRNALVSPFLAERIWDRTAFDVELVRCKECGFIFYNPRLEDSELGRLYQGYRLPEYLAIRNSHEPWYTSKMNASLASPASYGQRRERIGKLLSPHLQGRQVKRVLDHGGDRGDLVDGLIDGAQAFVFDISGVTPVGGVKAVSDPTDCKADLTINSNVLEHVGFPLNVARAVFNSASKGSLVFLEVPCEIPTGIYRIARRIAQTGMVAIFRPAKVSSLLSTKALYLMHEHINYFTLPTLERLTEISGGRIIASGLYRMSGAGGTADMGWTLSEAPV